MDPTPHTPYHDGTPGPRAADPMTPADPDLDLLESYLDGELSPAEIVGLERRVRAEPDLADALARLNAEFAVRQAVWKSLEPTEPEQLRLARCVAASTRHVAVRHRLARLSRFAGAAAACVAVGFLAGWVGRGNATAHAGTSGPSEINRARLVQPVNGTGPGTTGGAEETAAADPKAAEPYVYQVALTDADGNITAVQKFDNLKDARNFAAEVGRWQARQLQLQDGQGVFRSSGL